MGEIAAKTLVQQIEGIADSTHQIVVEPEFIVRASTGPAPSLFGKSAAASTAVNRS
jgi:DNA-binding LacI/PurR family transcriptional regulator